jgi:hypothetical protein
MRKHGRRVDLKTALRQNVGGIEKRPVPSGARPFEIRELR